MELRTITGDITAIEADAVVNAANSTLLGGGGVDGAIHRKGGTAILDACKRLRATELPDGLPAGQAIQTTAGGLPARWVIHTVGPVYSVREDRTETLVSCYRESLLLAKQLGAKSIAFPAISAGVYGWPLNEAARIAVDTTRSLREELEGALDSVTFVAFSKEAEQAFRAALVV